MRRVGRGYLSRAAEVLDARGRRMLAERAVASVLLAAAAAGLPGGESLAPLILCLGLTGGVIAGLAHRWAGPMRGRAFAWGSMLFDLALASLFVYATGGATSAGFVLYLLPFLTPVALREPAAALAVAPAAAAAFLLAAGLAEAEPPAGAIGLRLAMLAVVALAAVRVAIERRALVAEQDRRVQELSAINSMAHELTAILDPEALLWRVVALVRDRFGHARVRIGIRAGNRLLVRTADGAAVETWPLDATSLLGEAASAGTTALDPRGPGGAEGVAIPLVAGGRVRGALEVAIRAGGAPPRRPPLGARDVRSLEALAALTAVALENAELHQSAVRSALTDPLTGLFNMRYLQETLGGALERALTEGRPFSLLMLDVDNLREVNNSCGHVTGDGALREVGRVIAGATRGGDIAARYGGDEFLLALPDAGPEAAAAVAERIRLGVEAIHLVHRSARVPLTVSIGVASHPRDGSTLDALVEAADRAAYRAKARGRNRIALLSPADADLPALEPPPRPSEAPPPERAPKPHGAA